MQQSNFKTLHSRLNMEPSDTSSEGSSIMERSNLDHLAAAIMDWYYDVLRQRDQRRCGRQEIEFDPLEHQTKVVALLEKDPTLAGTLIDWNIFSQQDEHWADDLHYCALNNSNAYPLTYLIHLGCSDFTVVRWVYELFPDAVRQVQGIDGSETYEGTYEPWGYPVLFACRNRPLPNDIVIFLANAYPEAVKHHVDLSGRLEPNTLALFEALAGGEASFELIQTLVQYYPESARHRLEGLEKNLEILGTMFHLYPEGDRRRIQGKLLLEELIFHGYASDDKDPKIIDFALNQIDFASADASDALIVAGNNMPLRFGRLLIQNGDGNNTSISLEQFVGLLDSTKRSLLSDDGHLANNDHDQKKWLESLLGKLNPNLALLNITYSLLREAPYLWSDSAAPTPVLRGVNEKCRSIRRRLK